jgi:hypothetical protein
MRRDWDERARTNARYYVATASSDWTDEDFFRSGEIWMDRYIEPLMAEICRGRSPKDLRVLEIGCGAGRELGRSRSDLAASSPST